MFRLCFILLILLSGCSAKVESPTYAGKSRKVVVVQNRSNSNTRPVTVLDKINNERRNALVVMDKRAGEHEMNRVRTVVDKKQPSKPVDDFVRNDSSHQGTVAFDRDNPHSALTLTAFERGAPYDPGANISVDENKDLSVSRAYKGEYVKYTVQAGAFSNPDNAASFANLLESEGYDAYYFKDDNGLFKVRFGNYNDIDDAHRAAAKLVSDSLITSYMVIAPGDYAVSSLAKHGGRLYLRREIVRISKNYIGVPYKWGGNSKRGIDCSGLTQAVYNLNGLKIPRNSREQFRKGNHVPRSELREGDLVFFATNGSKYINHVGIYIGEGNFIHAPSRGKKVTIASLSNSYFARAYKGGRSYID